MRRGWAWRWFGCALRWHGVVPRATERYKQVNIDELRLNVQKYHPLQWQIEQSEIPKAKRIGTGIEELKAGIEKYHPFNKTKSQ
ncbi:MAG: hypothetical protein HC896_08905 [Bacteroidales bacterium]|nr:hypothetical protein [Bacteroidales bacterium]